MSAKLRKEDSFCGNKNLATVNSFRSEKMHKFKGFEGGQTMSENSTNVNVTINNSAPVSQLRTNRGLAKFIVLSTLTLGIYALVVFAHISEETNIVCSRYDGQKTMNYWLLVFIVAPLTLGIGYLVWHHKLCARIGSELTRRGLDCKFGAGDFWGWNVLGTLIVVGPFIFCYKLFKAMNTLNADFNSKG